MNSTKWVPLAMAGLVAAGASDIMHDGQHREDDLPSLTLLNVDMLPAEHDHRTERGHYSPARCSRTMFAGGTASTMISRGESTYYATFTQSDERLSLPSDIFAQGEQESWEEMGSTRGRSLRLVDL